LGELIRHAVAALPPNPPALFSWASDVPTGSEKPAVPSPVEMAETDGYRDLVLTLPAVPDFTRTPRRYR